MRTRLCQGLIIYLLGAGGAAAGRAQGASDQGDVKPQMMARDADPDWDVVAVKPNDPNSTDAGFWIHDRGVEIKRKTAEQLLMYGYGLQENQVLNAPDWMRTERWYINGVAGVPGQPNREQMGSLVRKLLAERFGLVVHHERADDRLTESNVGLHTMKTSDYSPDCHDSVPLDLEGHLARLPCD